MNRLPNDHQEVVALREFRNRIQDTAMRHDPDGAWGGDLNVLIERLLSQRERRIAGLEHDLAAALARVARLEEAGDQAVAVLTSLLVTHPQGDPIHRHVERVRDGLIAALEAQP